MLKITLSNSGGPLDSIEASTWDEAAEAAIQLIKEAGSLREGDVIAVTGEESS